MRLRSWFELGLVNILAITTMTAWTDLAVAQGQPQAKAPPGGQVQSPARSNAAGQAERSGEFVRSRQTRAARRRSPETATDVGLAVRRNRHRRRTQLAYREPAAWV